MSMENVTLRWDGDRIVQSVKVKDHSFSAKDLLDQLQQVEGQLAQMEQQKEQMKTGLEKVKKSIESTEEKRKLIVPYKEGCQEKQLALLKVLINQCKVEAEKKAIEMSDKEAKKDPSALTPEQENNQRYVMYQRLLGTNPKIANKIAKDIITKHLFDKPIFDNPFAK